VKKLLALLMVLGMVTVIGCGGTETKKDTKASSTGTSEPAKKTGP
jgi:hypothetical protein